MLKVLSNILCDLDPKVKVIGQKAGICDGVPSTSALVYLYIDKVHLGTGSKWRNKNTQKLHLIQVYINTHT